VRSRAISALAAASLLATIALGADREPSRQAIAVVVGAASPVRSVTKDILRELYLRRQRLWSDGTRTIPINLPPMNPVREEFSKLVLGRSTRDMVAYWNGRYFEGITPPQVLPSSAAIRLFLAAELGAIAYLPLADVDATCRTLLVLDPQAERGVTGKAFDE
jgi:hypothetical protein